MYVIYWRELIFISRTVGSLGISPRKKIVPWSRALPKFMAGFSKSLGPQVIKDWMIRWGEGFLLL